MRLASVESGHRPEQRQTLEAIRTAQGREPPDVIKTILYRPELFGGPYSDVLDDVMRGPSEWSPGERELFAAFVSAQNQCPF